MTTSAGMLDSRGERALFKLDARIFSLSGPRRIRAKDLRLGQVQRDLVARLPGYSGAAARAYESALCILNAGDYADRDAHLAYVLRDVVRHLSRLNQNERERDLPLGRSRCRTLLMGVFDRLRRRGLEAHCSTLADAHAELDRIAHQRDPDRRGAASEMMPRIEDALHALTAPRAYASEVADEIMPCPPTAEGAARLVGMMSSGDAVRHIMSMLPPGWLGHMADAGLFDDPSGYGDVHPYLCRCAGSDPGAVAGIITSYDPGAIRASPDMCSGILECASILPAAHAKSVLEFMGGAEDLAARHPENLLVIAASLCAAGEISMAADLARMCLAPENVRRGMYPGSGWLGQPLARLADAMIREDPLLLFGLLADLLEAIIGDRADDDASGVSARRPDIAESDCNTTCPESSMIRHMRDCLSSMRDPDQLREAMAIAGRKRPLVYRRLEMFVYDAYPGVFEDEMIDYALRYLGHPQLYREHYLMLNHHYCSLPPRAKRRILDAIMRDSGDTESDELRRLRYLECIKDCLDGEHSVILLDLVSRRGRDPHPGYLDGPFPAGPAQGPGPLGGKDADRVIRIMSRYRPEPDAPVDGVLRGFSNLASSSPVEFSRRAMDLARASPDVQGAFFRSMGRALRDGREIDWGGAIRLARHAVDVFAEDGRRRSEDVMFEACSMLEDAFQHAPPDAALRDDLRDVVMRLVDVSMSDRDGHLKYFEDEINMTDRSLDAFNMAINNPGGRSFLVMMMYALWCGDGPGAGTLPPEVRDVLDRYVDGSHTVSRNAIIGAYFPNLYYIDRDWAMLAYGRLCPAAPSRTPAKIAFWDGYVRWTRPHEEVISDLDGMYKEFLTGDMSELLRTHETFKSTFDHLLAAYLYGHAESGPIFEEFLDSIKWDHPADLLEHYVSQVGMVVRSIKDASEFDVGRLENLWKRPVLSKHDRTDWFVGSGLGRRDSIRLYSRYATEHRLPYIPLHLLDELESYADEFPREVAVSLLPLVSRELHNDEKESIWRIVDILERHRGETGGDLERITGQLGERRA